MLSRYLIPKPSPRAFPEYVHCHTFVRQGKKSCKRAPYDITIGAVGLRWGQTRLAMAAAAVLEAAEAALEATTVLVPIMTIRQENTHFRLVSSKCLTSRQGTMPER